MASSKKTNKKTKSPSQNVYKQLVNVVVQNGKILRTIEDIQYTLEQQKIEIFSKKPGYDLVPNPLPHTNIPYVYLAHEYSRSKPLENGVLPLEEKTTQDKIQELEVIKHQDRKNFWWKKLLKWWNSGNSV